MSFFRVPAALIALTLLLLGTTAQLGPAGWTQFPYGNDVPWAPADFSAIRADYALPTAAETGRYARCKATRRCPGFTSSYDVTTASWTWKQSASPAVMTETYASTVLDFETWEAGTAGLASAPDYLRGNPLQTRGPHFNSFAPELDSNLLPPLYLNHTCTVTFDSDAVSVTVWCSELPLRPNISVLEPVAPQQGASVDIYNGEPYVVYGHSTGYAGYSEYEPELVYGRDELVLRPAPGWEWLDAYVPQPSAADGVVNATDNTYTVSMPGVLLRTRSDSGSASTPGVASTAGVPVAVFHFQSVFLGPAVRVETRGATPAAIVSRSALVLDTRLDVTPGTLGGFPGSRGVLVSHTNTIGPGAPTVRTYSFTVSVGAAGAAIDDGDDDGYGAGASEVQEVITSVADGQTLRGTWALQLGADVTPAISAWAEPGEVQNAIHSSLRAAGRVTVTRATAMINGGWTYRIVFRSAIGNVPEMRVLSSLGGTGANVTLSTVRDGNVVGGNFTLTWKGVTTAPIDADADAAGVQAACEAAWGAVGLMHATVTRSDPADRPPSCTTGVAAVQPVYQSATAAVGDVPDFAGLDDGSARTIVSTSPGLAPELSQAPGALGGAGASSLGSGCINGPTAGLGAVYSITLVTSVGVPASTYPTDPILSGDRAAVTAAEEQWQYFAAGSSAQNSGFTQPAGDQHSHTWYGPPVPNFPLLAGTTGGRVSSVAAALSAPELPTVASNTLRMFPPDVLMVDGTELTGLGAFVDVTVGHWTSEASGLPMHEWLRVGDSIWGSDAIRESQLAYDGAADVLDTSNYEEDMYGMTNVADSLANMLLAIGRSSGALGHSYEDTSQWLITAAYGGHGGSHGGRGGLGHSKHNPRAPVGDAGVSDLLGGSGGAAGGAVLAELLAHSQSPSGAGGHGGGAIELIATTDLVIGRHGAVTAHAQDGGHGYRGGGGGAGGSVVLAAGQAITVRGEVGAEGGHGGHGTGSGARGGGGGSGGRVVLFAQAVSYLDAGSTSVAGGSGGLDEASFNGTAWLPTAVLQAGADSWWLPGANIPEPSSFVTSGVTYNGRPRTVRTDIDGGAGSLAVVTAPGASWAVETGTGGAQDTTRCLRVSTEDLVGTAGPVDPAQAGKVPGSSTFNSGQPSDRTGGAGGDGAGTQSAPSGATTVSSPADLPQWSTRHAAPWAMNGPWIALASPDDLGAWSLRRGTQSVLDVFNFPPAPDPPRRKPRPERVSMYVRMGSAAPGKGAASSKRGFQVVLHDDAGWEQWPRAGDAAFAAVSEALTAEGLSANDLNPLTPILEGNWLPNVNEPDMPSLLLAAARGRVTGYTSTTGAAAAAASAGGRTTLTDPQLGDLTGSSLNSLGVQQPDDGYWFTDYSTGRVFPSTADALADYEAAATNSAAGRWIRTYRYLTGGAGPGGPGGAGGVEMLPFDPQRIEPNTAARGMVGVAVVGESWVHGSNYDHTPGIQLAPGSAAAKMTGAPVAHRWYKLDILLNWVNQTYRVRIDDVTVALDQPFNGTGVTRIGLYVTEGTAYFDEVYAGADDTMGFECPVSAGEGRALRMRRPVQAAWRADEVGPATSFYSISRHSSHLSKREMYVLEPYAGLVFGDGQPHRAFFSDIPGRDPTASDSDGNETEAAQGDVLAGALLYVRGDVPITAIRQAATTTGVLPGDIINAAQSRRGLDLSHPMGMRKDYPDLGAGTQSGAGYAGESFNGESNPQEGAEHGPEGGYHGATGRYYWYGEHDNGRFFEFNPAAVTDLTSLPFETLDGSDGTGWNGYTDVDYRLWMAGGIGVCSTSDMAVWRNDGFALYYSDIVNSDGYLPVMADADPAEPSVYRAERPRMLINTNQYEDTYVMWMAVDDFHQSRRLAGVAQCDHPAGPCSFTYSVRPDNNATVDLTVMQDPATGEAVLVRTYYATTSFYKPDPIMQPIWESVKGDDGTPNFPLNYHRAYYAADYDNPDDIFRQRWRMEDLPWNITTGPWQETYTYATNLFTIINTDTGQVDSYTPEDRARVLSTRLDRYTYRNILGQGRLLVTSRYQDPFDPYNSLWYPSSVPAVKAQTWADNYRDKNIADNPPHPTVPDLLIGPNQIVEQRRTKYLAISKLTADYLNTSGTIFVLEGSTENGDNLITILSEYGQFGWSAGLGNNDDSTYQQDVYAREAPFGFDTQVDWEDRHWQYTNETNDRALDFRNFRDRQTTSKCPDIHHLALITYAECQNILNAKLQYVLSPPQKNYVEQMVSYFYAMDTSEYEGCLARHAALLQEYQECVRVQVPDLDSLPEWGVGARQCVGGGTPCGPPEDGELPEASYGFDAFNPVLFGLPPDAYEPDVTKVNRSLGEPAIVPSYYGSSLTGLNDGTQGSVRLLQGAADAVAMLQQAAAEATGESVPSLDALQDEFSALGSEDPELRKAFLTEVWRRRRGE